MYFISYYYKENNILLEIPFMKENKEFNILSEK